MTKLKDPIMKCSSGFIKDLAYLKFAIIVLSSGEYESEQAVKNCTKLDNEIDLIVKSITNKFNAIIKQLTNKDREKVDKKNTQIVNYFIKRTVAANEIEKVAVELFGAYVLKYRFLMYSKRTVHQLIKNTLKLNEVNLIIQNVIKKCNDEKREFFFEIELAKDISKYLN